MAGRYTGSIVLTPPHWGDDPVSPYRRGVGRDEARRAVAQPPVVENILKVSIVQQRQVPTSHDTPPRERPELDAAAGRRVEDT
jgi:hypothetical protein